MSVSLSGKGIINKITSSPGRSRDRRFTLKPVYSAIANKHLFTVNQKGHIFYPAEQIEDICKKLNIPISQVITIGVI
jgi:hypothetical protein